MSGLGVQFGPKAIPQLFYDAPSKGCPLCASAKRSQFFLRRKKGFLPRSHLFFRKVEGRIRC
jgi:hypothetical protein